MTTMRREQYSIVIANNPKRDALVVELALGEEILIEFYIEEGQRNLAIYTQQRREPIQTNADLFLEAFQDAMTDALTLIERS